VLFNEQEIILIGIEWKYKELGGGG